MKNLKTYYNQHLKDSFKIDYEDLDYYDLKRVKRCFGYRYWNFKQELIEYFGYIAHLFKRRYITYTLVFLITVLGLASAVFIWLRNL